MKQSRIFSLKKIKYANLFVSKTIPTTGLNHCYMHYKHLWSHFSN